MSSIEASDKLEPLAIVTGAFLVLVGLGTVIGMPWQTNGSTLTSVVQLGGILATMAVGAGLVWLARLEA